MERNKKQLDKVQGIAFDLEGTIINLESLHHTAHLQAAAKVGVVLSWQEALKCLPHFIGGPDEEVAAEIVSLADGKTSVQDVLKYKQSYYTVLLQDLSEISPRKGFVQFLKWIKGLGIKVIIGTVTDRTLALHFLKQSNLLPIFGEELVVAREDIINPKPAPDVYYETARRLGISPENQLVFEDSRTGVISAHAAGSRLVAIPTVQQDEYIKSLYESGAEVVFETWEDPNMRSFVLDAIEPKSKSTE